MANTKSRKMNYNLVENHENSNMYNVLERTTNQVIKSVNNFSEARELMRHLNLGGCFDGYTPSFFLKTLK